MDLLPVDPVPPNYLQLLIIGLKHLKMAIQLMYFILTLPRPLIPYHTIVLLLSYRDWA